MNIQPVQVCHSTIGWSPVEVPSTSEPGHKHLVLVNPRVTRREFVCDCKGYEYRGECRHQKVALTQVCWWPLANIDDTQQDSDQAEEMICPRCSGPTMWEMMDTDAQS